MARPVSKDDQREFEPIFERLRAEALQRFGFHPARLAAVSYEERPFSRLCRAAVSRDGAAQPELHVFIKIFKPKDPAAGIDMRARVRQDFDTTSEIYSFMSGEHDLGVVKPVACYDDLLTIVTEQADGVTLLEELEAHATWFPRPARVDALAATLETVGRWLRRFQGFHPSGARLTVAGIRDYVDIRLVRLVEHGVMPAQRRQQILEQIERLGSQLTSDDLVDVAVHADVAPANILVSGRSVVMLDFAMASRGTRVHDISRLYMQLDLLKAKPQFRAAVLDRVNASLLRGFDPALTPRAPLFRLISLLHHVNHLGTLSRLRERFPARVLSARIIRMHRAWIERELGAATGPR
jgi:hypothetical protein